MRSHLLSIAASALLLAAPLAAAEGGGASPFSGDVGNAIWTLVIFLLVVLFLGKFAWGPLLKGLQSREEFIRSSLETAKRDREAAEARASGAHPMRSHSSHKAQGVSDADTRKNCCAPPTTWVLTIQVSNATSRGLPSSA